MLTFRSREPLDSSDEVRLRRGRRVDSALDVARDEPRRIYEAIVGGDPELARAAATAHIASSERWPRSQLQVGDPSSGG